MIRLERSASVNEVLTRIHLDHFDSVPDIQQEFASGLIQAWKWASTTTSSFSEGRRGSSSPSLSACSQSMNLVATMGANRTCWSSGNLGKLGSQNCSKGGDWKSCVMSVTRPSKGMAAIAMPRTSLWASKRFQFSHQKESARAIR